MAAFKLKLEINQGSTFRQSVTWKAGTPAVPVDLTGFKARMQARADIDDAVPLFELTTENGGIALNVAPGRIDLYMSAAATALLKFEIAVYDVEFIAPGVDGDVSRRIYGPILLSREVTR